MPPRQTRASTAVLLHLVARGRRRTVSPAWETARHRDKASPPPSPGRRRKREGRRWRRKKMDGNLTAVMFIQRVRNLYDKRLKNLSSSVRCSSKECIPYAYGTSSRRHLCHFIPWP
uniref:Uncharacterized protein n=1 Tax=Oryza sativa subsp. japonica TaxID=39947 RepID=Q6YU93_ORYSJ|nr:hypothetical protein [Oryza sativa Japonica Group]BAD08185.1 hypothetical protein [Oryza sativa Japonica Group]